MLLDFKNCDKARVINSSVVLRVNRQTDQWNKTENLQIHELANLLPSVGDFDTLFKKD